MDVRRYTIKVVSFGTVLIENKTGKIVRCFATESEAWDFFSDIDKEQENYER